MKFYAGLTKSQFDVLTLIAFGSKSYFHGGKIIDKLLSMGLIIHCGEQALYGKSNHPIDRIPIMTPIYRMPISEHIKFCDWCSKHPELDQ